MQVDHIIVGQGISGSLLAHAMLKEGCRVLVIDDYNLFSASRVAGGIINPVTGKRRVRSWMIDELMPFALNTYRGLSEEWEIPLLEQCNILEFHYTQEQKEIFAEKLVNEKEYLSVAVNEAEWGSYFRFNYGIGIIDPCYLVGLRSLLKRSREKLTACNSLLEERFSFANMVVREDHIVYKNITAQKIIFCEGAAAAENPYFNRLPWSKDKGEALILSIPGLPRTHIFKQGISIIPWGKDEFWVGATHDWKYTDLKPTEVFRKKVELQLDYWLKIPYEITAHLVAQRPVNMVRKPFAGFHPKHPSIGILNGMGGKGCSMAPYFAHQLAQNIIYKTPILPDADVKRFERILSK